MTEKKKIAPGNTVEEKLSFTEMAINWAENLKDLSDETFAAIDEPPSVESLRELIVRADSAITEYQALIERSSGGRREMLERSLRYVKSTTKYLAKLRSSLEEKSRGD